MARAQTGECECMDSWERRIEPSECRRSNSWKVKGAHHLARLGSVAARWYFSQMEIIPAGGEGKEDF